MFIEIYYLCTVPVYFCNTFIDIKCVLISDLIFAIFCINCQSNQHQYQMVYQMIYNNFRH